MGDTKTSELKPYPIQLRGVTVKEMLFEAVRPLPADFQIAPETVQMEGVFGTSKEDKEVQVGIGVSFGFENPNDALVRDQEDDARDVRLRVRIVGHFVVDENVFPMERLEEWGKYNAPIILYPFLREHVYSLTVRCAIAPLILPSVYLPTMKIESPVVSRGVQPQVSSARA